MKHILLFFLSNIHLNKETGEFIHSKYLGQNGRIFDCVQTNEAAVDYMMSDLDTGLDALFFFSSNKTKECLTVPSKGEPVRKTQIDWFKERVCNKYPALQNAFHNVDYDESKDTDESIRQVTEMTGQIKSYLDESDDKEICLHADMTGGFRHASMMMLSVMQLLSQYKGIKIGKVLYSNWMKQQNSKREELIAGINETSQTAQNSDTMQPEPTGIVEDVTEVHRMFMLVSGTDEFVNYGSVKEIERYFANRPKSPALEALLKTMRDFSDAIKICRTNKIEGLVRQLRQRIKGFSDSAKETVHEGIFAQVIMILHDEYGKLLSTDSTQLDIIEWCVKKGFLQQAMTLCTEWLPKVLVDKKICYTDDPRILAEARKQDVAKTRTPEQSFIVSYKIDLPEGFKPKTIGNNEPRDYKKAVMSYILGFSAEVSAEAYPEAKEPLQQLFNECDAFPNIFTMINNGEMSLEDFALNAPLLDKACRCVWSTCRRNNVTYKDEFDHFLKRINVPRDLIKRMENLSAEQYGPLLGIEVKPKAKISISPRWNKRKTEYLAMIEQGIMKTDYPDKILFFLGNYFGIREERNNINHASQLKNASLKTNREIEEMITRLLVELKKCDDPDATAD